MCGCGEWQVADLFDGNAGGGDDGFGVAPPLKPQGVNLSGEDHVQPVAVNMSAGGQGWKPEKGVGLTWGGDHRAGMENGVGDGEVVPGDEPVEALLRGTADCKEEDQEETV